MARHVKVLEGTFQTLENATNEKGLTLSKRRRYMFQIKSATRSKEIVREFEYLGVVLSDSDDTTIAIQDRIQTATYQR